MRSCVAPFKSASLVLLVSVGVLFASPEARAQENDAQPAPVIRLEELRIEGKVQQPEAFYILPRTRLNYEGLDRDQSFLHRVSRTLDKPPLRLE